MRRTGIRTSVRGLMGFVALSAVTIVFGSGTESTQYSCHLCHNRKQVNSLLILVLPLWREEKAETNFPFFSGHNHDWYCYSTVSRGFRGKPTRACRIYIYADKSVAPDGVGG